MKWSVAICTDGKNWHRVHDIINSLMRQSISTEMQIIVIGGQGWYNRAFDHVWYIPFDESYREGWITKKKNAIANVAAFNNICIVHDYVSFDEKWVEGFEAFGENWISCITPIKNLDGSRFRDWCEIYNDAWMDPAIDEQKPPEYPAGKLIDYTQMPNPRWQYYSGAYFCIKKQALIDVPFDESRLWGQGEDVQWSRNLYKKYGEEAFKLNPNSHVKFLKHKGRAFWE
jgi:hypothetical protein